MGHAPQSFATAASERIRSGLSPKTIKNSAALLAPTPNPARRVGDVSVVSRARCRSCVAISSARANQRRASARRVYFAEAVGVGSGLASELRAQGDFLSVAACEVRPEARKPVTHVHGP